MENLSISKFEYLKTIYFFQNQNEDISITKIANKMNVSKAAVIKMLRKLEDDGYITYETLKLSDEAIAIVKKSLEEQNIVYLFFKEILKLSEDESKEESEKLNNILNDNTLNSLAKYVNKKLGLDCNYDINNLRCRTCSRRKK